MSKETHNLEIWDESAPAPHQQAKEISENISKKWRHKAVTYSWLDWVSHFVPCVGWLRTYKKEYLLFDLIAGISVGFMVVPQGMSYAATAGVPSVYGLYGAFLPCMVYGLVGSSRQLAVGPVAVTSLLIATNLETLLPCHKDISNYNTPKDAVQATCQEQYNHAAIRLAFLVACLYTGIGVLRLGWVTKFLSHAVIGGFTSGASWIIALGQFKYIVGYNVKPANDRLNLFLTQYLDRVYNLKWGEFLMGMTLIGVMVFFKEGSRLWSGFRHIRPFGPIMCCIIGLCAVYIGHIDGWGIKLVGTIPKGLPSPSTFSWWSESLDGPSYSDLFPTAIVVMFVDLLESTSIARALARKNGYDLAYNREIVGLGLANFAGALSNAYTTTGSFSRSAVNNNSGARTPLSQFVCAWVVGFVLIFLTPIFENLPMNVLGAIIVPSVLSLFEYEQAIYLWKVNKLDFCTWMASFFGTLFYSVEVGLAIAVGLALLIALYQVAFPAMAVVGQLPGKQHTFRSITKVSNALVTPGILIYHVDAPLFYGNVTSVQDSLEKTVKKYNAWSAAHGAGRVHVVILDLQAVLYADSMGLHLLEDLVFWARKQGLRLMLAGAGPRLVRDWTPVKLPELVGRSNLFAYLDEALGTAQSLLAEQGISVKLVPSPTEDELRSLLASNELANITLEKAAKLAKDSVDSHHRADSDGQGSSSNDSNEQEGKGPRQSLPHVAH